MGTTTLTHLAHHCNQQVEHQYDDEHKEQEHGQGANKLGNVVESLKIRLRLATVISTSQHWLVDRTLLRQEQTSNDTHWWVTQAANVPMMLTFDA